MPSEISRHQTWIPASKASDGVPPSARTRISRGCSRRLAPIRVGCDPESAMMTCVPSTDGTGKGAGHWQNRRGEGRSIESIASCSAYLPNERGLGDGLCPALRPPLPLSHPCSYRIRAERGRRYLGNRERRDTLPDRQTSPSLATRGRCICVVELTREGDASLVCLPCRRRHPESSCCPWPEMR